MKPVILSILVLLTFSQLSAQKVDSIYFNLYTDSLKKGQYNYINVDGKLSNGKWMPLTNKEIEFTCSAASFDKNQLIIPENFAPEKVTVKAVLLSNRAIWIERTIWIKKIPDGALPTKDQIMQSKPKGKGRNR